MLPDVVVDLPEREVALVHLPAIGAALLLPDHREALAGRGGLFQVFPHVQETLMEPGLAVQTVVVQGRDL